MSNFNSVDVVFVPDEKQTSEIDSIFRACRYVWNKLLAARENAEIEDLESIIERYSFLAEYDKSALNAEESHLNRIFKRYHQSGLEKDMPRFKNRFSKIQSYTTSSAKLDGDTLKLVGVDVIKLPETPKINGHLDAVTIKRDMNGQYHAIFRVII